MQYVWPKYTLYVFYQVLWKFYLYGDCVNFGKKYWSSSWLFLAKTWCQKISNVYQMDARYIFSNVCLCSQGEDLQCFCGKKISPVLCANILREHICHFQGRHQMFLPIIVSCMVTIARNSAAKTGDMFSSNVCTQNWTYFFSPKHWRCSPWGHRKSIGENISCICLVDIPNFLPPCFLFMFLP